MVAQSLLEELGLPRKRSLFFLIRNKVLSPIPKEDSNPGLLHHKAGILSLDRLKALVLNNKIIIFFTKNYNFGRENLFRGRGLFFTKTKLSETFAEYDEGLKKIPILIGNNSLRLH